MLRINFGCGRDIKPKSEGWINIDKYDFGQEIIHDLDFFPYPIKTNSIDEIYCRGFLSESQNFIKVMEEIYRISKDGAKIIVEEPLFGELAFQHPLTKKVFTWDSFAYFPSEYSEAKFIVLDRHVFYSHNRWHDFLSVLTFRKPRYITFTLQVNKEKGGKNE